jgi:hypothetical protein
VIEALYFLNSQKRVCTLYSEPFKILKEKIPFVEYVVRSIKLIIAPAVEKEEQIKNGRMKYALLDIFLSISLFSTIIAILAIFSDADLTRSLSAFSSQFALLLEFGYYAYFSVTVFFLIIFFSVRMSCQSWSLAFRKAFIISLQYARFYALFLSLFLPLVVVYLSYLFDEFLSPEQFANKFATESSVALVVFTFVYVWCCLIPIKRYWSPVKSRFISYVLVLLVTNLAFMANSMAPKLGALELNMEQACILLMESDRLENLTDEQRIKFKNKCLSDEI